MPRPIHPVRRPVVVTGASSGIGAATAVTLAALGHPVALGARRTERLEDLAASIREAGGEAVARRLDLADACSVSDFAEQVQADLGDIEVVVSSGAVLRPGTLHEIDSARFAAELEVNLVGAHRLVRTFAPAMVERQRGDLVFVSSDAAIQPRPFMASYTAGKWGLEGLVRSLQMELEGTGVRCSVVRPGSTASEMGSDWEDEAAAFVITQWLRFGLARHPRQLPAAAIADAIAAVVSAPRGVHLNAVEVTPEAPLRGAERVPPTLSSTPSTSTPQEIA